MSGTTETAARASGLSSTCGSIGAARGRRRCSTRAKTCSGVGDGGIPTGVGPAAAIIDGAVTTVSGGEVVVVIEGAVVVVVEGEVVLVVEGAVVVVVEGEVVLVIEGAVVVVVEGEVDKGIREALSEPPCGFALRPVPKTIASMVANESSESIEDPESELGSGPASFASVSGSFGAGGDFTLGTGSTFARGCFVVHALGAACLVCVCCGPAGTLGTRRDPGGFLSCETSRSCSGDGGRFETVADGFSFDEVGGRSSRDFLDTFFTGEA